MGSGDRARDEAEQQRGAHESGNAKRKNRAIQVSDEVHGAPQRDEYVTLHRRSRIGMQRNRGDLIRLRSQINFPVFPHSAEDCIDQAGPAIRFVRGRRGSKR